MIMAKRTAIIPRAAVARILVKNGAGRVGEDAVDAFREVLEDAAKDIAERSVQVSKHAGRKTIHEEDIKLAVK